MSKHSTKYCHMSNVSRDIHTVHIATFYNLLLSLSLCPIYRSLHRDPCRRYSDSAIAYSEFSDAAPWAICVKRAAEVTTFQCDGALGNLQVVLQSTLLEIGFAFPATRAMRSASARKKTELICILYNNKPLPYMPRSRKVIGLIL